MMPAGAGGGDGPGEELPGQLALPGMPGEPAPECYRAAIGLMVHGPGCTCPADHPAGTMHAGASPVDPGE